MLILSKDPVNSKATNLHEYDEFSQEGFDFTESVLVKDVLWVYTDGFWVQGTHIRDAYAFQYL